MSNLIRYLLTVDSTTGATVKVERLGEAGELTEVPVGSIPSPQGMVTPSSPQSVVVNIYMGGPQPTVTTGPAHPSQMGGATVRSGSPSLSDAEPPPPDIIPGGGSHREGS